MNDWVNKATGDPVPSDWTPAPPLKPTGEWACACGCDASGGPSIADGITITGKPGSITSVNEGNALWALVLNDGKPAGDMRLDRFDDSGAYIDSPMTAERATGTVYFNDPVLLSRDPVEPMEPVTLEYLESLPSGVEEAPINNTTYGRDNGTWVPLPANYIPEAPGTSQLYSRMNSTWALDPIQVDAPAGGGAYARQNGAWVSAVTGGPYLPLSGGVVTGPTTFQGSNMLVLNSPPNGQRAILGQTATITRWQLLLGDGTPEGGGNVGSNFQLNAYSTVGAFLGTWMSIARADGNVVFNGSGVTVQGSMAVNGTLVLASPNNLAIYGGTSGQVLTTNGSGILSWAPILIPPPGVPEAPTDGQQYARQNAAWSVVTGGGGGGGIPEAPLNANAYMRSNGAWTSGGTLSGSLTVTGALTGSNGAFSGSLSVGSGWTTANFSNGGLSVNLADGGNTPFLIQAARAPSGGVRWTWQMPDGTAETGGNAGSNFVLTPYGDNGVARTPALSIARATSLATVAGDPTAALGVATKQYVDAHTTSGPPVTISDTAPASPVAGALWWDSVGAQLYVWFNDGNSSQWVIAVNAASALPPASTTVLGGVKVDGTSIKAAGDGTISTVLIPIGDNRIINGDMRIDQRNNGASGNVNGVYTVDRWIYGANQTVKGTWGRNTGPVLNSLGFGYCLTFTSSSAYAALATDHFEFRQSIEADMISDFAWGTANAQPVTLSFLAQSTIGGVFSGSITNYSGSPRSYPFTFSLPTNIWTKITVTIPGDTAGTWVMSGNAGALSVAFDLGCGANFRGPANAWASATYYGAVGAVSTVATNGASFQLSGVKLEIGSIATPFNRQSLTKSLADCQRYYYGPSTPFTWGGYQPTTASMTVWAGTFPVTMRAAPTTSFPGQSFAGVMTGVGTPNVNTDRWLFQITATGAGAGAVTYLINASAEL